jgi:hypothetical protein
MASSSSESTVALIDSLTGLIVTDWVVWRPAADGSLPSSTAYSGGAEAASSCSSLKSVKFSSSQPKDSPRTAAGFSASVWGGARSVMDSPLRSAGVGGAAAASPTPGFMPRRNSPHGRDVVHCGDSCTVRRKLLMMRVRWFTTEEDREPIRRFESRAGSSMPGNSDRRAARRASTKE